jgi:hypothetical protein
LRVSGHSAPLFFDQHAAEDMCSGRAASQLFQLCCAVKAVKADAGGRRSVNGAFAFDRIAEREALRRDIQPEAYVDLRGARQIEIGAERRQGRHDLRAGFALTRNKSLPMAVLAASLVAGANDLEIEHDKRGWRRALARNRSRRPVANPSCSNRSSAMIPVSGSEIGDRW